MKRPAHIVDRPAVEFLPLAEAPPDCTFQSLDDGLRRVELENPIDLIAALRDGFKLIVYRPASGNEMLVDALAMNLEAKCLRGSRDAAASRAMETA